jgi:hypothetical protein
MDAGGSRDFESTVGTLIEEFKAGYQIITSVAFNIAKMNLNGTSDTKPELVP